MAIHTNQAFVRSRVTLTASLYSHKTITQSGGFVLFLFVVVMFFPALAPLSIVLHVFSNILKTRAAYYGTGLCNIRTIKSTIKYFSGLKLK